MNSFENKIKMFEIVKLATTITFFGPTKSKHGNANKTKSIYLNTFKFFDYIFLKCFLFKKKNRKIIQNISAQMKYMIIYFLLQFVIYAVFPVYNLNQLLN